MTKVMAAGTLISGISMLSAAFQIDVPAGNYDDTYSIDPHPDTVIAKVRELPFRIRTDHITVTKSSDKEISTITENISWEKTFTIDNYDELSQHIAERFPIEPLLQGAKGTKSNTVSVATVQDDDVEEVTPSFSQPVADAQYTSFFGMRNGRHHNGVDIVSASKTLDIYAAKTGTVVASYRHPSGLGNLIILDHGNGWETYYGHLSERYVKEGDVVRAGDIIGVMGSTGNSTGVHLHFEIRKDNKPLNPYKYIK